MVERPLLIYLPGLDATGKLFERQSALLAPLCDVQIVSLGVCDRGDWAELTQQVISAVPVGREVILCGESFGGCWALRAALAAPRLFQSLVLINPATAWPKQLWLMQAARGVGWLPDIPLDWAAPGFMYFLAAIHRITPPERRLLLKVLRSVPASTIRHRLTLLEEPFCDPDLAKLTLPILLVAGGADRLLPSVSEVNRLAKLFSQVQTQLLPYSGHAALLEEQTNLAELLGKHGFLNAQTTSQPCQITGKLV